jgi:hypothetical protein
MTESETPRVEVTPGVVGFASTTSKFVSVWGPDGRSFVNFGDGDWEVGSVRISDNKNLRSLSASEASALFKEAEASFSETPDFSRIRLYDAP